MDTELALRLLSNGPDGIRLWNRWRQKGQLLPDLSGAILSHANLVEVNLAAANLAEVDFTATRLTEADLSEANLADARMAYAELSRADLTGASLSGAIFFKANLLGANLTGADLTGADLIEVNLTEANLAGANLTFSRFIRSNLAGAFVENALVGDTQFHELTGLPTPPEVLRLKRNGAVRSLDEIAGKTPEILRLTGEKARLFFFQPETVEVVLDRALSHEALAAYYVFLSECEFNRQWPPSVLYDGGRLQDGRTVLSYRAPTAKLVLENLALLLQPFRVSQAVDWKAFLDSIQVAEEVLETILARPIYRSFIAERLASHQGYADAVPAAVRVRERTINLDLDQKTIAHLSTVPQASIVLQLVEGDTHVTTQHFHGGHFQGCSFGDANSVNNYFAAVAKMEHVEVDIKEKLKEARAALEQGKLADPDKQDAVQQLIELTKELEKLDRQPRRVQRYWNRIKEIAPPVASILESAASLAELLAR